jgi:hypothetical protein
MPIELFLYAGSAELDNCLFIANIALFNELLQPLAAATGSFCFHLHPQYLPMQRSMEHAVGITPVS